MTLAPPPTRSLTEAILDSGIQTTNFFNGRILNAGDLQTDQDANRAQREQLGLAIGHGIVQGFWVELASAGSGSSPPTVAVSSGLALNANGQALSLPLDVTVALTRATAPPPVEAGLFTDCAPPADTTVPVQAGIYILAASPASGYSGSAPMYGFGDTGAATGCGSRYAVEGVRFRLEALDVSQLSAVSQATRDAIAALMQQTATASLSKLRNWIAHLCFGTEELAGFLANPFPPSGSPSPFARYGAIDALLQAGTLTTGDVPLALLYWTVAGVQFIDRWSVRRRPVPPALTDRWPVPFGARGESEAEAAFLQFQEQVQAMIASASPATLAAATAVDWFRYLPASGIVPLAGFGPAKGFDPTGFFAGHTTRGPLYIEGARLRSLLRDSLSYPPIDMSDQQAVWLYAIRENMQAVTANPLARPTAGLVFATGHIPYRGNPHFDLSRWDFANFALTS